MSRSNQYRVTHQPGEFQLQGDPFVYTIPDSSTASKSKQKTPVSSGNAATFSDDLGTACCCACLWNSCQSDSDNSGCCDGDGSCCDCGGCDCGACDCSGCDCSGCDSGGCDCSGCNC